jgi:SAM-dependent methyltransferase
MSDRRDPLSKLQRLATRYLPKFLVARLDPVDNAISERVEKFARSLPENALVLDAGAGEARFRSYFARQRYVALDNRQGDPTWNYSALNIVGDLLALPLGSDACDAVLNVVVLEHTSDPRRVLSELHRVLRPQGRLLLAVPLIWELHQVPHDYFRFTRYGLERLLSGTGLELSWLLPVGGYFWLLGRYSFYFLKFWRSGIRVVFLPFLAPVFGFVIPLLCSYLDRFDRTEIYTQLYICEARKP